MEAVNVRGPLPERLCEASSRRRRDKTRREQSQFLKGPVPTAWLAQAAKLPGKALAVGIVIWFRSGLLQREDNIDVTDTQCRRFGVDRKARYRALQSLEHGGLIAVSRQRGRCPRVRIVRVHPASSDHDGVRVGG